jgi:hypothetical protein
MFFLSSVASRFNIETLQVVARAFNPYHAPA